MLVQMALRQLAPRYFLLAIQKIGEKNGFHRNHKCKNVRNKFMKTKYNKEFRATSNLEYLSKNLIEEIMTSIQIGLPRVIMSTVWKVSVFGVFLVRIFPYLDWIQKDTEHLSVFSKNVGKYGPKKLRLRTLFTQWGFSEKMQIGWRAYFNIMIYLSWYLAMKIYARRYIC